MEALWTMHYLSRMRYFLSESVFNPHRQKGGKGEDWGGGEFGTENSIISCTFVMFLIKSCVQFFL